MYKNNPILKWFVGIAIGILLGLFLSSCTVYKYESPTVNHPSQYQRDRPASNQC